MALAIASVLFVSLFLFVRWLLKKLDEHAPIMDEDEIDDEESGC